MHLAARARFQRAAVLLALPILLAAVAPFAAGTPAVAGARPQIAQPAGLPAVAPPGGEFRWSVVPSSRTGPNGRQRFEYGLAPGGQVSDWVAVSNLSAKPLTFILYATDAFTSPDGGFALLPASEAPSGTGAWITLRKKEFRVPAGKRVDIPFGLRVPANATPGDHIGGLLASVRETQTSSTGQRLEVERRVAARVYLRVTGPVQPVTLITALDVSYDPPLFPVGGRDLTVTYRVANDGNVRVSGAARIRVEGPLGVRVANSELIDIPELLPDSEVRITRRVAGVFAAGRLNTSVTVNLKSPDGPLPSLGRSTAAWAVPWAVPVVLLLVAAVVGWRWVRRRRNSPATGTPFVGGQTADHPAAAT